MFAILLILINEVVFKIRIVSEKKIVFVTISGRNEWIWTNKIYDRKI